MSSRSSGRLPVVWQWVTESALLARTPADDVAVATLAAHALHAEVEQLVPGLDDVRPAPELVVGAGSLLVRFAHPPPERAVRPLVAMREIAPRGRREAVHEHRFDVTYGGADGPDLAATAARLGATEREVVALHSGALYTVAFVGFSPGFAYLLGLPRELERPRRSSPRPQVPAGSVAIAGPFSAIYPRATPGGWHLLGRAEPAAESALFDLERALERTLERKPAALLAAGDRVRFVPR